MRLREKHGQPWTRAEIEVLRGHVESGLSAAAIAVLLRRSIESVTARTRREGLKPNTRISCLTGRATTRWGSASAQNSEDATNVPALETEMVNGV